MGINFHAALNGSKMAAEPTVNSSECALAWRIAADP